MQEKKLLRDALQAILDYIESGEIDVFDSYGNLLEVAGMADKALASTTEETEMEKLVAWLERKTEITVNDTAHAATSYAYEQTLKYITTQFGEGEG